MTAVPSDVVTRRKAAITSLTTAGYTLIPLRGKIPVDKGWQTTLAGAYGAAELGEGNYGVALRSTDLVVDVDPRNFNPVTESGDNNPLARLLKDLNGETDTLIVRTGGGGLHIYMTLPEGVIVANTIAKYGKGVEFKSAGRQVVGPGSIHPETGKEYEIVRGDAASIMAAPESLIADIKKIPISHKGDKGTSSYKDDKYTQDSFISYLQQSAQPSIEGQQGDLQAFRVGCHAKEMGLSPAVAFELMMEFWNPTCVPPWGEEELGEKIGNAYTYAKSPVGAAHPESDFSPIEAPPPAKKEIEIRWDLTANGAVRKSFVNLLNYLNQPGGPLRGIFGRNDFAQQAEIVNPAPWHNGRMPPCVGVGDHDLKMLKGYLATAHNFEMPIGNIEEAVAVVAHHNHFHPIKEYLEGLKWDGEKRLDLWLIRGGGAVDTPYVRAVSRKVLCAAVMRIFRPGIKFDSVLVLEGGQGIGKSGLCKIMGGEWYGEFTVNPHDKDTIQLMQGKWIMEIAEMAQGRKVENEAKKAFITRATDKARLAYGRLAAEYPRQSVFFATTNPKADGVYLDDDTGNRRWWPVFLRGVVGKMVDFKWLKENRNQIFAEAVAAARAGENLYMDTEKLQAAAAIEAEKRNAVEVWTQRVGDWVAGLPADRDFVTARDIFVDALSGLDKQLTHQSMSRIAQAMKNNGYEQAGPKRIGGKVLWGYDLTKKEVDLIAELM